MPATYKAVAGGQIKPQGGRMEQGLDMFRSQRSLFHEDFVSGVNGERHRQFSHSFLYMATAGNQTGITKGLEGALGRTP